MSTQIIARLLRIFFHLLYHQFAWAYDFVAATVSLGQWNDWVMTILPYLDGPRVLELGFGPGHLQSALTSGGVPAFGVDTSPQMACLASRRLIQNNQTHHLANAYAQHLPFADQSFQQVAATFPPEFILAEDTFSEAYRVLAPGGSLVVLPTVWITGRKILEKIAAWIFDITNQAPSWDDRILEYFTKAGFQPRLERASHKSWSVVIVLAKKIHAV